MRSKLFVPGARPELFAKALAGDADALSFDLEDSVVDSRKAEAREAVRQLLRTPAAAASGKVLIVRINALDTPHFAADLQAMAQSAVHLINLPKAERVDEVQAVARALDAAEATNGVTTPLRLLLNIETPRALQHAAELAAAHPRVAGLQLGLGDLFEPLGIDRREVQAVAQVMLQVRLAAGTAGVWACDGAFADIRDADGYRAEAALARRLGFVGKSCIHPSQVALAHDAFRPTPEQLAHAQRVLAAAEAADSSGTGAFVVDGRMVDRPFIDRARALLAQARAQGLAA